MDSRRLLILAAAFAAAPIGAQVIRRPPPAPERPKVDSTLLIGKRAPRVEFGVIDGAVTDSALQPLANASIVVFRSDVKVTTGPNGRFRITRIPSGQYLLIVRGVGFHPVSGVIEVPANDTVRMSYQLEPLAQGLAAVNIVEQRTTLRQLEFDYRRKYGQGEYMGPDEIEKKHGVYASEVLRWFRSVRVADVTDQRSGFTDRVAVSTRSNTTILGKGCQVTVLLDGVKMPENFNLDVLPPPRDLAGIEVYTGPAQVPAEFTTYDKGCGVVLFWTKDSP